MPELSTLGGVIKLAYEGEANTNAFTDADRTKLDGIEEGAEANAVTSVAGKTGAVTLVASDVGALPDDYTPPAAPVQSVNGKTGAVQLSAADVGALPTSYAPAIVDVAGLQDILDDLEQRLAALEGG